MPDLLGSGLILVFVDRGENPPNLPEASSCFSTSPRLQLVVSIVSQCRTRGLFFTYKIGEIIINSAPPPLLATELNPVKRVTPVVILMRLDASTLGARSLRGELKITS